MSRFKRKSKGTAEAVKKMKEKGGNFNKFKITKSEHHLLILGVLDEGKSAVKRTFGHT